MKIKLSKNQWENIGKGAGWVKKSGIYPIGPEEKLMAFFQDASPQIMAKAIVAIADPEEVIASFLKNSSSQDTMKALSAVVDLDELKKHLAVIHTKHFIDQHGVVVDNS